MEIKVRRVEEVVDKGRDVKLKNMRRVVEVVVD